MRKFYTINLLFCGLLWFTGCDPKPDNTASAFTKADSLADVYLRLQDTLHLQWNIMIHDDNEKIKAMNHLLHELAVTGPTQGDLYKSYRERLNQLSRIRFTQKSMINPDVVAEYDMASKALILELIGAAESKREYAYNITLQKLADNILLADQRMVRYRAEYDSLARVYNRFVNEYKHDLTEASVSLEPKPFFQISSSE